MMKAFQGKCHHCGHDHDDSTVSPAPCAEVTVSEEHVRASLKIFADDVLNPGWTPMRAMRLSIEAAILAAGVGKGDAPPIILERRYLKSRAVGDETYSEHSEGWSDAMDNVAQQLEARGIAVAWRDWIPAPPSSEIGDAQ